MVGTRPPCRNPENVPYSQETLGGDVFFFPEDVLNTSKQAEKGSVMENGAISLDIPTHPVDILPVFYLPIFPKTDFLCVSLDWQ